MSAAEFAGLLRERIHDAEGAAHWAHISLQGRGDALVADVWRAPALWRVTVRAQLRLAPGTKLQWRTRKLAVLRIEEDPLQPDRIQYICEERS